MTRNLINSSKPIDLAKGGTATASFTANGVAYYDGAELNSTAVGTAGQVLTSNGPSSPATFQNFSAGGPVGTWKLIQTQTLTGTTPTVTFASLGSYVNLAIVFSQVYYASGSATNLLMTFSADGGSTWVTTGYASGLWYIQSGVTAFTNVNSTSAVWMATGLGNLGAQVSGIYYVYGMNTASSYPCVKGEGYLATGIYETCAGYLNTACTYNALQITLGTANITGQISLYGIATS